TLSTAIAGEEGLSLHRLTGRRDRGAPCPRHARAVHHGRRRSGREQLPLTPSSRGIATMILPSDFLLCVDGTWGFADFGVIGSAILVFNWISKSYRLCFMRESWSPPRSERW